MTRAWRPLAALLVSRSGALTGHRLLMIAVPWLVITTGTLTEAGTVALCHTLPYVIMQGLSGPLLDRIPPARVAAGGDLIGAAAVATLAAAGTPPLWLLMAAMAVVGAADGPAAAAKNVLLPDVTVAARQPPDRGQALAVVAERAASTLGPALAGLLISLYGTYRILWLASLLFSVASALAWRIRLADRRVVASEPDSYLRRLRAGVRVVFRDRPLRAITIMYIATTCLDSGLVVILIPLWARENGHSATFAGLMLSAAGGAAVCSAIAAAWLGARLPRRAAYLTGVIISGPSRIIVLALDCPPTVIIAVYAIAGVGSGIFNPAVRATIAEVAPAELRGRVYALVDALSWIGLPIAGLLATTAVNAATLPGTLWLFGIAYLLAVLYPARQISRRPARSATAELPASRRPEPGATSRAVTPQWSTPWPLTGPTNISARTAPQRATRRPKRSDPRTLRQTRQINPRRVPPDGDLLDAARTHLALRRADENFPYPLPWAEYAHRTAEALHGKVTHEMAIRLADVHLETGSPFGSLHWRQKTLQRTTPGTFP